MNPEDIEKTTEDKKGVIFTTLTHKPTGCWVTGSGPEPDISDLLIRRLEREVAFADIGI